MTLEHLTQEQRVKFLNKLRSIIGETKPKNKVGVPIVTEFDMINATDFQKKEALNFVYGKIGQ